MRDRYLETHRRCGCCDCRTLQRAVLNFIGLPVWRCLNCLTEVNRKTRATPIELQEAFDELTEESNGVAKN